MNDQSRLQLNAAQRAALRKALTASDAWKAYSANSGVTIANASVSQLLKAADELAIEGDAYLLAQAEAPRDDQGEAMRERNDSFNASANRAHAPALDAAFAPATDNPASQLASLIGQIAGQSMSRDAIERLVDARLETVLRDHIPVVRLEVKGADGVNREVNGHKHPAFEKLLRAATARMANGFAPNIWLAGPAGSGKTHACHQAADAMGRPFHFNGAISQEYALLGFVDAGGAYHRTPFREAYEHGGFYCFDEVDGSDNSAVLALNAALANGHATFPDGAIKRHQDCVIIATANTWGLGATAEYVGRAKLDAAFLSRFAVRIAWDYDTALELNISGDRRFAQRVIDARARARAAGLKVLIDPRASQAGAALIANGMTPDEAAELTYLANLNADQRKIVEGH